MNLTFQNMYLKGSVLALARSVRGDPPWLIWGGWLEWPLTLRDFGVIQNPSGFGVFRPMSHWCFKGFGWNFLISEKYLFKFGNILKISKIDEILMDSGSRRTSCLVSHLVVYFKLFFEKTRPKNVGNEQISSSAWFWATKIQNPSSSRSVIFNWRQVNFSYITWFSH